MDGRDRKCQEVMLEKVSLNNAAVSSSQSSQGPSTISVEAVLCEWAMGYERGLSLKWGSNHLVVKLELKDVKCQSNCVLERQVRLGDIDLSTWASGLRTIHRPENSRHHNVPLTIPRRFELDLTSGIRIYLSDHSALMVLPEASTYGQRIDINYLLSEH